MNRLYGLMGPLVLALLSGCTSQSPTEVPTDPQHTGDTADTEVPMPSTWTTRFNVGSYGTLHEVAVVEARAPHRVVLGVSEDGWHDGNDWVVHGIASIFELDLQSGTTRRLYLLNVRSPLLFQVQVSAPGDLDGDGHVDVLFGHIPSVLARGPFADAPASVVELPEHSHARAIPCDVDRDGQADLCLDNGRVDRGPIDGVLDLTWEGFGFTGVRIPTTVLRTPTGADGVRSTPLAFHRADYNTTGTIDPAAVPTWAYPPGFELHATAAWDPDGDGVDDLLVCASQDGVPGLRVIDDFDAQPPVLLTLPAPCVALVPADFDGDGRQEIAVGGGSRVRILDPEDWSLLAEWVGEISPGNDDLGAGLDAMDVDGDGRADLFAGAPGSGYVYVTTEAVPR